VSKKSVEKVPPSWWSGLERGRKKKWLENGLKVFLAKVNNFLNLTF